MGIIKYADIFGDLHLVEFCHRAQFGPIDWEGVPVGQPLRIRGIACEMHNCEDNECGPDWHARATAVASRRPETSNTRREAGIAARTAALRSRRRDFSTAAVSAVAAGATRPSAFHA